MMLKKFSKALGRYKKIRSPDNIVRLYEVLSKLGKYNIKYNNGGI